MEQQSSLPTSLADVESVSRPSSAMGLLAASPLFLESVEVGRSLCEPEEKLLTVAQLILALYSPQTAHADISAIQETLQRIQRSSEGWQLAQALLDRPTGSTSDVQIRFFGALTIIVKLNTESSSLSEDDARGLLQNLLRWLVSSAAHPAANLSTQKLCHALVTFFIQFPALWPHCAHHLLLCLRSGNSVPVEEADGSPGTADLALGMDGSLLCIMMWFLNTLVTDVGKTDMRAAKYYAVHEQLLQNASDVVGLFQAGLSCQHLEPSQRTKVRRETMTTLQSWILYCQRLPVGDDVLVVSLRALVEPVMACLQDSELYDVAIELLSDILSNYSSFFTPAHYEAMASMFDSPWGEGLYGQLLGGNFEYETLQYGLLMLAYSDARVQALMQSTDARDQRFLSLVCGLLSASGDLVAEDLIFVPALEYWSTFIETLLDTMFSDGAADEDGPGQGRGSPAWVQSALSLVMRVVAHCWEKIQYPPMKTFLGWDPAERAGFADARKDVADLLQTVFTLSGRNLLAMFSDLLLRSMADKAWAQIEAAAFCLASLSDCVSDDCAYDELLHTVFSSPLFRLLDLGEAHLPVRLRQTALLLIERYSEYFERNPAHLPSALNLLFDAVASSPSLANTASKAISKLCSSCRALLTSEAGAFLEQYRQLHDNPQLDALAEERTVYAIACVIQAVAADADDSRLQLFEHLLSFVVRDVEQCLQLLQTVGAANGAAAAAAHCPLVAKAARQYQLAEGQAPPALNEILLQAALISLRCLASMARGMQETAETLDLDADDDGNGGSGDAANKAAAAARQSPRLQALQSNIMSMMVTVQTAFPRSSEIVEVICTILKAGFLESAPGPFVFSPDMVTEMLSRQTVQTPYIASLVNTAQSFASSLTKSFGGSASTATATTATEHLNILVPWVLSLLQALPEPEADPELTQRGIEFVDRVMRGSTATVLQLQPGSQLEFFFLFTLKVLNGPEPLSKAASADFWADDPSLQAVLDGAMEHLGPMVAEALMLNIGGNASRSELDKLCEPIKRLVVKHVRAQAWIEQALASPSFPSDRVTAAEKSIFVKKIITLRGARQTNNVVREFWLACRGSNFAYAS